MHLEAKFLVSQRRVCAVSGQSRSTQRRLKVESTKEDALVCHIEELVREHPRYGYRRITSLLGMEGWEINKKRVHRIWKVQGYRVNQAGRTRHAKGIVQNACNKRKAGFRNDVWSYDFIFDRLENGKPIKILAITDEYTRTSILFEAASSLTGSKVLEILNRTVAALGLPCCIRSDNGSEFTGDAIRKSLGAGRRLLSVRKRLMKLVARLKPISQAICVARTLFTSARSRELTAFTSKLMWTPGQNGLPQNSTRQRRP